MSKTQLEEFTSNPEAMRLFQQERLIMSVTEMIYVAMKEKGIKQSDLAQMLGKSKGRISQYLTGEKNMTLRTIADIFTALGKTVRPRVEPISIQEPQRQSFRIVLDELCVWTKPSGWRNQDQPVETTCENQALAV